MLFILLCIIIPSEMLRRLLWMHLFKKIIGIVKLTDYLQCTNKKIRMGLVRFIMGAAEENCFCSFSIDVSHHENNTTTDQKKGPRIRQAPH